ncbi:hypothetical protein N7456_007213 [Penicillium angulare]|uniref:Aminoglycoside phosphotransferase domain-containing protein n=1 Tax=Penicillium angulare TaxID=116970 RepID=A0A9W9KCW3_9EURO|nr:hypothetical protein N7456_007213 [Penicillium angulare]
MEVCGVRSEARGTFVGSKVSGDGPNTAVIKIRLQIPWYGTVNDSSDIRAKQATSKVPWKFQSEIDALTLLTKAECSCTPRLYDSSKGKQSDQEWIPGGYKLCILMEMLPGSTPSQFLSTLSPFSRTERDLIRQAFKDSWFETVCCGAEHQDEGLRNIIWDPNGKKCYLVDWENWRPPNRKTDWSDIHYVLWNLARRGNSDSFDMSDWELL